MDDAHDESPTHEPDALISQLREEISYLRDENRRKDEIIMQQTLTMRQVTGGAEPREPLESTAPGSGHIDPNNAAQASRESPSQEEQETAASLLRVTENVSSGVLTQLIAAGVTFVGASVGTVIAALNENILAIIVTVAVAVLTAAFGIATYRLQRRASDARSRAQSLAATSEPTSTSEGPQEPTEPWSWWRRMFGA